MKILDRFERKFGRFYIKNLMVYIVIINAFVYLLEYSGINNLGILNFVLIPQEVMQGQVWRLITFIFIPPSSLNPLFLFFALYFNYLAGAGLENYWGGFKFNVYYLCGMLATIIVSFITGMPADSSYINLALFLAFACVYPDYELLLFFILPIKVKYLAILDCLVIGYEFITVYSLGGKLLVITPLISFLLFFGKDLFNLVTGRTKSYVRKQKFSVKVSTDKPIHRCTVCGITDKDDPDMQFRYCSKCSGTHCYCMNHIRDHKHIE
ncbi:rhomboid family intramembrane serine protease [Inconstantimicrobium mannanitabidum]|uniref:Uncharacterized protein n=1 Tax=Inconstantimicrobium mannanitabidum TaxID=1604901 RepID=A0ACB5RDC0_9CLOT|nr:hypothetical protein [Clostridium sp. TW13]GKX67263.1 hypothetical protein rsdtw13_25210 [Clostridium sp. TW13]